MTDTFVFRSGGAAEASGPEAVQDIAPEAGSVGAFDVEARPDAAIEDLLLALVQTDPDGAF